MIYVDKSVKSYADLYFEQVHCLCRQTRKFLCRFVHGAIMSRICLHNFVCLKLYCDFFSEYIFQGSHNWQKLAKISLKLSQMYIGWAAFDSEGSEWKSFTKRVLSAACTNTKAASFRVPNQTEPQSIYVRLNFFSVWFRCFVSSPPPTGNWTQRANEQKKNIGSQNGQI